MTTDQKDACCTLWSMTPTAEARSLTPNAHSGNDSSLEHVTFANSCRSLLSYKMKGLNEGKSGINPEILKKNRLHHANSRRKVVSYPIASEENLFIYWLRNRVFFAFRTMNRLYINNHKKDIFLDKQTNFMKNDPKSMPFIRHESNILLRLL